MSLVKFALLFGLIGLVFGLITEKPWVTPMSPEEQYWASPEGRAAGGPKVFSSNPYYGSKAGQQRLDQLIRTIGIYILAGAAAGAIVGAILQAKNREAPKS